MPHALAFAVEVATTVLTVAGIGYFLAALVAARIFISERRRAAQAPPAPDLHGLDSHGPNPNEPDAGAPGVSILKSLKGLDPGMLDAFRSHCVQTYAGDYELLFGISDAAEPAAEAVRQLQREFPDRAIRIIDCPQRLGTNGKVSTLAQMVPEARYDFLLINDSDITVSPRYLERVMRPFADPQVGMVTALYRGKAHRTLASRFEALGIATDFQAGVLLSKMIEGGLKYGLGSTLAVRRVALERIGGYAALADYLADDYELGARVAQAGYRVALTGEVVETGVPAYGWRGFADHQMRWLRTVRDARPWGYAGLIFTHGLAWAVVNVVVSGVSPLSLWLLALSFFLRLALAMTLSTEVLGDRQALAHLWLLPVRDIVALGLWAAGFAGDEIVWRGERFRVKNGKLSQVG